MGRTNIKTPTRGSEYFIRPYARGKNDTYMDVSQQVTQAYVDTQVIMPHSIFSRPYLADAYPEMEYVYKPTIPVIPPFDPATVPGATPVVPEVQLPGYVPTVWSLTDTNNTGCSYEPGDVFPTEDWDTVHDRATSTRAGSYDPAGFVFSSPGTPGPGLPWIFIRRGFIEYDLSGLTGTILNASIWGPTPTDNGVLQETLNFTGFPAVVADYRHFKASSPFYKGEILCELVKGSFDNEFNSAGIAWLQARLGSKIVFCIREKDHDYDDIDPASGATSYEANISNAELRISI